MANLIIKPTSGGSLILQDEGGSAALTVATAGTTTFAESVTLSGTTNNLGTVTAGTITGGTLENAPAGLTTKAFGFSAYLSTGAALTNGTWMEASNIGTWTERWDTDGKYASGRFTPTIQGLYLCGYATENGYLDDHNLLAGKIRKNGSSSAGDEYAFCQTRSTGTDGAIGINGSSIIQLDTDDYISWWCNQASGGNVAQVVGVTEFWAIYQGQV